MSSKADKLTAEQRTEAVYRLILDGWTVEQIVENARKSWQIKDAMIYRYIERAWQRIEAVAAPEREEHHRRAVAAHYQMLREAKTTREKMMIWASLARLLGLDAPKAVQISGRNGGPIEQVIQMTWGDNDSDGDTADGND